MTFGSGNCLNRLPNIPDLHTVIELVLQEIGHNLKREFLLLLLGLLAFFHAR